MNNMFNKEALNVKVIQDNEVENIINSILCDSNLDLQEKLSNIEKFIIQDSYQYGYIPTQIKQVQNYIREEDWRVNENSNTGYSHNGLLLNASGYMIKEYMRYQLNKIDPNISEASRDGDIHIHDLTMSTCCYCYGGDIKEILLNGFRSYDEDATKSKAPKHLDTALMQICNSIFVLSTENAGAISFNDLDIYLAYFIMKDELSYDQVEKAVEKFVFNLCCKSRNGGQSPFSNIGLSLTVDPIKDNPAIFNGKLLDVTYGDLVKDYNYQYYIDMFNEAFINVMMNSCEGGTFPFPIPTFNITDESILDTYIGTLICKLTAKYGTPYFGNYLTTDLDPTEVRSMCCRLNLNLKDLKKHMGNAFLTESNTGSIGVVTLNLGRYGYLANNKEEFFNLIKYYANLAKKSLVFKRKFITEQYHNNMYPYTKIFLKDKAYKAFFSTIGVLGGHEACMNLLGKGIETEEGKAFMIETLNYLLDICQEFTNETGDLFNLEATPI